MSEQDPEAGGHEPEEAQTADGSIISQNPKRRRRMILLVIGAIIVVVLVTVAITLALVLNTDDEDEDQAYDSYQDILKQVNMTRNASDAQVEQALGVLAELFLTTCPAGVSIAVTRNGTRVIVPQGVLKIDDGTTPIDQDTLFEIGSISKPFTGAIFSHQIVKGYVDLDTPLNERLPESVPDLIVQDELVTFRQLVTHTAGFPRLPKVVYDNLNRPNPYAGYNETDLLREIGIAASGLSQTGAVEYSNFGFSILAYLLGRNENSTFPQLQKDLTNRLGMNNTWIETLPEGARQHLSTGYSDGDAVPYWFDGGLFINGAGSTLSSTRDLLTLVELLMAPDEENLLEDEDPRDTLQQSLTPLEEISGQAGVAFAWFYGGIPRFYWHNGGTAGFASYVAFQPETGIGLVALSNCVASLEDMATFQDALDLFLVSLSQE